MSDTLPSAPKKPAAENAPVLLACVILLSGTKIGRVRFGKGAKIVLPDDQAKALAGLNPPAVRIDGIPS